MKNKESIPFHMPYPLLEKEIRSIQDNVKLILKSGTLTNDCWVRELEKEIQKMYGTLFVVATSSCTQGLSICLQYLEDRYIQVPMFEWWSVLYILKALKKHIAWNDVDINTWLPKEDYGGYSLYLNTFGNMGKSIKEDAIYDSSHCLGSKIEHMGLAHVFSLAPTKLITSCEGGIIITNNQDFYEFAKEKRDRITRMSEIHALIGVFTLQHLEEILKWKRKVYNYYNQRIPGNFQLILNNSTYNTIGFLNTNELQIPNHIETKHYYEPIYDNGIKNNTKKIYEQIVCLPSYYNCPYEQITNDILELNDL